MNEMLSEAERVLEELVTDVEAVGTEQVKEQWPDLMPTYDKAKSVLDRIHLQKVSPELRAAALSAVEREYTYDESTEVDADCTISLSDDGAYVGAWLWLDRDKLIDHGWDPDEDL